MNLEQPLINAYEEIKGKVKLVDMSITQMAGYYLSEFHNNPVIALMEDVYKLNVPVTVAYPARTIIESLRRGNNVLS